MRVGRALLLVVLALPACHRARPPAPAVVYTEEIFARKPISSFTLALGRDGSPLETVIGTRRTYRIRQGDTFLDVARYHDLGYNEIVEANPGVDPWLPPVGATVVLPTEWTLPCCTYAGMVLNIPEMRLYLYRREGPRTLVVHTFPVGLGRDDRRTPRGVYRVRGKTVNPQWNIPESIRAEHIRERGDRRAFIRGGDPENPLGKYRFELTRPRYAIHGTNIPWGVGMLVSHGCARLYPEDMERLFPLVPTGTRVEFTYQVAKVGRWGGQVFVEVHPDIYRYDRRLDRAAARALARAGVGAQTDAKLLRAATTGSHGMPYRVSRG
jgi:L,D-transpeptidase ErfK/SrfK